MSGVMEKTWRRRADSNRGVEVLQTSALATWLRRPDGEMERETGFEPATPTLARSCSTTELFPRHSGRCYHDQLVPARRASAAASGGTGLMKKPLPHSNPATRVSFGITSRCQWNDSS